VLRSSAAGTAAFFPIENQQNRRLAAMLFSLLEIHPLSSDSARKHSIWPRDCL